MLTKYARSEQILEIKTSSHRLDYSPVSGEMISKLAAKADEGDLEGGYLYVRARAISSRVNKNNDGWPSTELATAYKTFVGRPVFVDHNNSDPSRTRGVIVDAALHVDEDEKTSAFDPYYSTAPDNHKPPTWVEILIEVDAKTFPKLAKAIKEGHIDATSMGANIDRSVCSVCANEASTPSEYCDHIQQKGATFEILADNGEKIKKRAYEDCYGVNFFEDSFVFDPADTTALNLGVEDKMTPLKQAAVDYSNEEDFGVTPCPMCGQEAQKTSKAIQCPYCGYAALNGDALLPVSSSYQYAHLIKEADMGMGGQGVDYTRTVNYEPQSDMTTAPQKVDTLKDDVECPNCNSDHLESDPDGILRCPTCGFEQPPEGLDNPDLGAAERHDEEGIKNPNEDVIRAEDQDADLAAGDGSKQDQFIEPIKPIGATKDNVATGVISEMIWKRKVQTNSAVEANAALRRVEAASVETPIEFQGGIHFGTHAAFKAAGIQATAQYPGAPQPLPIPGNAMQHFMMQMNAVKAQGLENPGQLLVRIDAPDDQMDEALRLIHNGGNLHEAAAPKSQPKKEVLQPQGKGGSDEPNNERIEADQLAPVTSDRRVIKREETPEGHRSEQIIEETGTLGLDDDEEPKDTTPKAKEDEPSEDEESDEDENAPKAQKDRNDNRPDFLKKKEEREPVAASAHEKLLAALAVAEEAVEIGFIPKEKKMAFIGMLESETMEKIEGRRETIALAKSAGFSSKRVAHTSRTALPRLGSAGGLGSGSSNGHRSLDEVPFEAVFLP